MRKLWHFHGGIHPEERKTCSNTHPIQPAGLPPRLIVPLQQHIGAPAKLLVSPGDKVLKGQKIGQAQGRISVCVHAPTSGTVTAIGLHPIPHPSGMLDTCVIIEPDGLEQWCPLTPCEDYATLTPAQLLERIREAGIAGMGGAGFPTEVKLHPPRYDKVNTLILNGVECEPYITADDRLMRERARDVVLGMEIMAYILTPGECIIGVEDNKPEAIAALKTAAKGTRIEIVTLPTKYPSGGEKQLVKILTGKEIPSGKIPADVGVMCQNVATATAVYQAITFGRPLISRITTLTGEHIAQPGNFDVLIGTPVNWLLAQVGHQSENTGRLIVGGPMMGFTLHDLTVPITKTTNCLLAASQRELPAPPPAQACIRCGMCEQACPAELLPQQLYWFAKAEEFAKAEHHNLFDCIECGACAFVCPSSIPLVQYYRVAKGKIRQLTQEQEKADHARERFENRQARMAREAEEKEARRRERAEAAAQAQVSKREQTTTEGSQDKSAQIQAALERVSAKKNPDNDVSRNTAVAAEASQPPPDLESLKKKLLRAQDKYDKMAAALEDAKQHNSDRVEALESATVSSREALAKIQAELAAHPEHKATNVATPPQGPDIEVLTQQLHKAEEKLQLMLATLDDAKANKPETVEKIERAIEKNRERVAAARQALSEARNLGNNETAQPPAVHSRNAVKESP